MVKRVVIGIIHAIRQLDSFVQQVWHLYAIAQTLMAPIGFHLYQNYSVLFAKMNYLNQDVIAQQQNTGMVRCASRAFHTTNDHVSSITIVSIIRAWHATIP